MLQGSNILGGLLVIRQGQGGVQYAFREKAFGDCAEIQDVAHEVGTVVDAYHEIQNSTKVMETRYNECLAVLLYEAGSHDDMPRGNKL